MNKQRRKELADILAKLEELENLRTEIKERLEAVRDEEQESLDNLPEAFRTGERGEQMQEYIDALDETIDNLDEFDWEGISYPIEDIIG